MKITKVVSIIFLIFFFFSPVVLGATLNVPSEYQSIQEAINASSDSDTIIVSDGTYSGQGNRDIDFIGKAIIVRSLNGPEVTIIDCQGSDSDKHRAFVFHSGETTSSVVDGFTIKNGYGPIEPFSGSTFSVGGGIYCTNYSSPLITNNIIIENTANYGGGIQCWEYSSPTITNNMINRNVGFGGGAGIYCYKYCSARIENNIITENDAHMGGGIKIDMFSSVEIINNIIASNSAQWKGAGIYCGNSSPRLTNNTVTENTCQNEGGGAYFWYASPTIVNPSL